MLVRKMSVGWSGWLLAKTHMRTVIDAEVVIVWRLWKEIMPEYYYRCKMSTVHSVDCNN